MRYLLAVLMIYLSCQQTDTNQLGFPAIDEGLADLKQQYAPDRRTAIFDIHLDTINGEMVLTGETNLPGVMEQLDSLTSDEITNQVLLLPDTSLGELVYGLVRVSVGNIRSQPRHSAELSTQATMGTPLKIYKREGGWYYVQTPDLYLGWLDGSGFEKLNRDEIQSWIDQPKWIYMKSEGAITDDNGNVVSDLVMGSIVKILDPASGKVALPDDSIGFVNASDWIAWDQWVQSDFPRREDIIETGKTLMGRPYMWGGTSSKAMDCSGFTKSVFWKNGLIIPRDASQQVMVGEKVGDTTALENALPGDLLFFGSVTPERERITHVGIYLGDLRMIHCGGGKVQIVSLDPSDSDYSEGRRSSLVRTKNFLDHPEDPLIKKAENIYSFLGLDNS